MAAPRYRQQHRGYSPPADRARPDAEAGTFDALFFADGLNFGPPATWAYKTTEDFEPLTTTAALSSVTECIGLVVTGSATLQHPYHLARQLLSLDHLSVGRAGWNLVTSFASAAADNFSARGVVDHDERYRIAEEAIDVVKKLWDSWGEDTIVEDRDAGIFNDVSKIRGTEPPRSLLRRHGSARGGALDAGPTRHLPGRFLDDRAGVRGPARRSDLHRAGQHRPGSGVLPTDPRRGPSSRSLATRR